MISVQNLSKYYGGQRVLGPISFSIKKGETVGFLGLNGAGKTTALRVLACDLRPSSGTIAIGTIDAIENPHAVRKQIGFLPESPPLYVDMTVSEYLRLASELRGMTRQQFQKRFSEVLDVTNLGDVQNSIIRELSHGYRQRVGVAQAIIHEPELLILDEPTRGLDPVQIVEMRNMIRNLKDSHTVLISSHILTEISQTCDRLIVLHGGKILATGSESDLLAQQDSSQHSLGHSVFLTIHTSDTKTVESELHKLQEVTEVVSDRALPDDKQDHNDSIWTLQVRTTADIRAQIAKVIVSHGAGLLAMSSQSDTQELESAFLQLVAGKTHVESDLGGNNASR